MWAILYLFNMKGLINLNLMAYDASVRISFPAVLWASVAISYCFYLFTGVIRMHHLSEEIESLERRERITGVKRL